MVLIYKSLWSKAAFLEGIYLYFFQVLQLADFAQTAIFQIEDLENSLQKARPYTLCQHMVPQEECKNHTQYSFPCPSSEDIKYRLTRASVDCIDLYIVEAGSALNLQVFRFTMYSK